MKDKIKALCKKAIADTLEEVDKEAKAIAKDLIHASNIRVGQMRRKEYYE